MLTKRDHKIMEFLEEFNAASAGVLIELFFPSYSAGQRRLTQLTEAEHLQRTRDGFGCAYVYYLKKPKQMRHNLVLADFYAEANKLVKIDRFLKEPVIGDIIPDGLMGFESSGTMRLAFIEVELSNKGFDASKYNRFDWKSHFPIEPELIAITDKKVPSCKLKTTIIDTDLNNIRRILQ